MPSETLLSVAPTGRILDGAKEEKLKDAVRRWQQRAKTPTGPHSVPTAKPSNFEQTELDTPPHKLMRTTTGSKAITTTKLTTPAKITPPRPKISTTRPPKIPTPIPKKSSILSAAVESVTTKQMKTGTEFSGPMSFEAVMRLKKGKVVGDVVEPTNDPPKVEKPKSENVRLEQRLESLRLDQGVNGVDTETTKVEVGQNVEAHIEISKRIEVPKIEHELESAEELLPKIESVFTGQVVDLSEGHRFPSGDLRGVEDVEGGEPVIDVSSLQAFASALEDHAISAMSTLSPEERKLVNVAHAGLYESLLKTLPNSLI